MRAHLLSSLLLSALAATVTASPAPSSHSLHERRDAPLKNWIKRDRLTGSTKLPMRIGLTQSNLEDGDALLMDVYVYHALRSHIRVPDLLSI